MRMLATQPNIDGQRIGALGHSRGGAAVLLAVHQQMTRAVLGKGGRLKRYLLDGPCVSFNLSTHLQPPRWCVSWLAIRIIGPRQPIAKDRQRPCEPTIHRFLSAFLRMPITVRLFFPLKEFTNVQRTRLNAPILYLNDQGAFLDLYTGQPIPGIDQFSYGRTLGLSLTEKVTVVTGSKPGQSEAFVEDMVGFFKAQLKP